MTLKEHLGIEPNDAMRMEAETVQRLLVVTNCWIDLTTKGKGFPAQ